jgi:hypothetical protein
MAIGFVLQLIRGLRERQFGTIEIAADHAHSPRGIVEQRAIIGRLPGQHVVDDDRGIAAMSPIAVASRACAKAGSDDCKVGVALEMLMKLLMMPQTVPKSPTKTAVEPMLASARCSASFSGSPPFQPLKL